VRPGYDGILTIKSRLRGQGRYDGGVPKPLQFTRYDLPADASLAAVLDPAFDRCGIYVLEFDDGSLYAGQTVDLVGRFAAHRRHQPGQITAIRFAHCRRDQLDGLEQKVVRALERNGARLRNILLTGLTDHSVPLDLVVDRAKQEEWLTAGPDSTWTADTTVVGPAQDRRQVSDRAASRFHKLSQHPMYDDVRACLASYVSAVLPYPRQTEGKFWVATALPSTNHLAWTRRLSAVSVNNVELLVLGEARGRRAATWRQWGFINVSYGKRPRIGPRRPRRLLWLLGSRKIAVVKAKYRTTGPVWSLHFKEAQDLTTLLAEPEVLKLARGLAIGQLRKGRSMFERFHNPLLADDVFAQINRRNAGDHTHARTTQAIADNSGSWLRRTWRDHTAMLIVTVVGGLVATVAAFRLGLG
jgi:hypothetical protein